VGIAQAKMPIFIGFLSTELSAVFLSLFQNLFHKRMFVGEPRTARGGSTPSTVRRPRTTSVTLLLRRHSGSEAQAPVLRRQGTQAGCRSGA
jgi:hypothetical protein